MSKDKLAIIFDCGATNVRVVAVNTSGQIAAMHAISNSTKADPNYSNGLIWDVEEIWNKFSVCCKKVMEQLGDKEVCAVTVTTFGVNGAPVDKHGKLLYPVISWQCQRTSSIMDTIDKYIPPEKLYQISGVNKFSFNTINVMVWLKENHPQIINKMAGFLFIPSVFVHKMTGELVNDTTMAGTSMMAAIKKRGFSDEIVKAIGVPNRFFSIEEPGTIVGKLTVKAAKELNLPEGLPVVLAGHDTQFALIGAGAGENEAVLSSGTWEILMTRNKTIDLSRTTLQSGVTNELDAIPGLYNTGVQWLASGVLEWVKNMFYVPEIMQGKDVYKVIIDEASKVDDLGGIHFSTDFINNNGSVSNIGITTSRQQIYRAALESLVEKTKKGLELLQNAGNFTAESLIIVGGGTKNKLWNQLRANRLSIPVKIAQQNETTVLGASLFAHTAVGNFSSIEEGMEKASRNYQVIESE